MFAAGCSVLGFCDAIFIFYQMIVRELKGLSVVDAFSKTEQKRLSEFDDDDQLLVANSYRRMTIFLTMKCASDFEGLGKFVQPKKCH